MRHNCQYPSGIDPSEALLNPPFRRTNCSHRLFLALCQSFPAEEAENLISLMEKCECWGAKLGIINEGILQIKNSSENRVMNLNVV